MKLFTIVLLALTLAGCAKDKNEATVTGKDGKDGSNGQSCSVVQTPTGAIFQCADGSTSTVNNGADGIKGDKGDQGLKGDTGSQGLQGSMGPQGPQGLKGDTGAVGAKGATGATGATGPQGASGLNGAQGPKGDTGLQGLKGDTGATGAVGATGANGRDGLNGTNGTNGVNAVILKIYENIPQNSCQQLGTTGIYVYHSGPHIWFKKYSNCNHGVNEEGVYCAKVAQYFDDGYSTVCWVGKRQYTVMGTYNSLKVYELTHQ